MSNLAIPKTTKRLVSEIIVPDKRQRSKAVADEGLLTSIDTHGLFNPITIRENGELVAGERRLDAHKKLAKEFIEVRIFEELSNEDAFKIELQENLNREDLSWQDKCAAVLDYHRMKLERIPIWTQQGTANDLGYSVAWVSKQIVVAEELELEGPDGDIATASSHQGALNLITTRAERATAAAQARGLIAVDEMDERLAAPDATKESRTDALLEGLLSPTPDPIEKKSIVEQGREAAELLASAKDSAPSTDADDRVLCADFIEWSAKYTGAKFEVIHCDFPYGKNYAGSNTRKTGKSTSTPTYNDSPDIFWALCRALISNQERILTDKAHMLFWFDMIHYTEICSVFTQAGWKLVQPYPLIWDKEYSGVAADTRRRPRHCYETCLMFSRGDRKITKLENDIGRAKLENKLHLSQKPQEILTKFLTLMVDEHTSVLDPTCGSGSALSAALSLGADRVLGLEIDQSNADVAKTLIRRKS